MPVTRNKVTYVRPRGIPPVSTSTLFVAKNNPLVGPYDYSVIEPVGSVQTDTTFNVTAHDQVIRNKEFFGNVNNSNYQRTFFENCIFHGQLTRGTYVGCINSSNDNHRGLRVKNCLFESRRLLGNDTTGAWGAVGRPLSNEWLQGIRGGNYTIEFCELRELSDYFSLTAYNDGGIYRLNVTIDANWAHSGAFNEWTKAEQDSGYYPVQGNYYTHIDGVQFHQGKNATITRNYFGGVKTGNYDHWANNTRPSQKTLILADDDIFNAGMLVKQETSGTSRMIEQVLIESNIFEGGKSCFNIVTSDGANYNPFSTLTVRENHFVRALSGVSQIYMLNGPNLGNIYNNWMYNEFNADGSRVPVPITRGY